MSRRSSYGSRTSAGFTLIEVMLSVSILTMMVALVWASFSLAAKSKDRAEEISARYHQIRLAMYRMAREISMAYLSKNQIQGTTNPRTMFVGERNSSVDELLFSSLSHMRLGDDAKECDQSLIRYYAEPDRDDRSQLNLMRRETRRLGVEKPGEEGPAYVMLENIKELHFRYFDPVKNEWSDRWNTRSLDGHPDRLPAKIEIQLTLADESGKERTFTTATRTHLVDPMWFTPK
jgi:general secretion pathway protein J